MNDFIDLTTPIIESTTVYPGDSQFSKDLVYSIKKGHEVDLHTIALSNHMGTHIDYPAHLIKDGKTSSDYPINFHIGEMRVIAVPDDMDSIDAEFIENIFKDIPISLGSIIFFKTGNSKLSKTGAFNEHYVFITPEGANVLVKKQIKIIGIDYLSVDKYQSDLPVHKILLENDLLIVENLDLSRVEAGQYQVFISPLNIPNMDGLPVRVFAKKIK